LTPFIELSLLWKSSGVSPRLQSLIGSSCNREQDYEPCDYQSDGAEPRDEGSSLGLRQSHLWTLFRRVPCWPIYCVASFLQGVFFGKIHRGELLVTVMDRLGSPWVLYERVVALPVIVRLLMELHFDFYAFVYSLNHYQLMHAKDSCVQNDRTENSVVTNGQRNYPFFLMVGSDAMAVQPGWTNMELGSGNVFVQIKSWYTLRKAQGASRGNQLR
jgi:hypothetical protein